MSYAQFQVDHNDKDNAALRAFNDLWSSHFARDSLLVFSTGRSHHLYEELRVSSSPNPPITPNLNKYLNGNCNKPVNLTSYPKNLKNNW